MKYYHLYVIIEKNLIYRLDLYISHLTLNIKHFGVHTFPEVISSHWNSILFLKNVWKTQKKSKTFQQ